MNIQSVRTSILVLGLAAFSFSNNAYAASEPSISLFTYNGERSFEQNINDPLLLYVSIQNTAAQDTLTENERNEEILTQYMQTEAYQQLTAEEQAQLLKRYAITEIPTFKLGSGTRSIESLIQFMIHDQKGDKILIDVEPLAANNHDRRAIELIDATSLYYHFAIRPEQMIELDVGDYAIIAALDTSQETDMWNGAVYSKMITITLDNTDTELTARRMAMTGAYYLQDHQYDRAETHAREFIRLYPDSIDAWGQLGEALYGLGQSDNALAAFNTAMNHFHEKYGDYPPEMPEAIESRIREIKGFVDR